ncbi:MAG TPA: CoA-transferase [Acidimicrobiales bacterium]|nr:CoA-transferase [Acidimicrobiales bacterium]
MSAADGSAPPRFVGLDELAAEVRDGDCLGVGGALLTRLPFAALHTLARRRPRRLTYASWGGGLPLEILLGVGAVEKIVFCFSSLDIFGPAPLFRRALESGEVEVEEWPAFALTARLEAAKQNLPVMPFRVPQGADLLAGLPGVLALPAGAPSAGSPVALAARLDLDAFLVHAQRADEDGNVEIAGARGLDATAAFAARRVLVTVEEVVPRGAIGGLRGSFVLPRQFVHGIATVPLGAYPSSCLPWYVADFAKLQELAGQSPPGEAEGPPPRAERRLRASARLGRGEVGEALAEHLQELASGEAAVPAAHAAAGALHAATAGALHAATAPAPHEAGPPTPDEVMVCFIASQLDDASICSAGAVSPLAVTSYLLAKATHAPHLDLFMTSGGLLDAAPRPMLLALGEALDTASAAVICGGEDSYRWYYQQGRVTCEIVTAAQIDRRGRTNNICVTTPSGRRVRLPGQGGMADVADLHQNFFLYLTRHSPLSLVESVERTSAARSLHDPAARVAAGLRPGRVQLVTNLGVFGYDDRIGQLVLESIHPGVGLEELRQATGFDPVVSDDLHATALPDPEVLRVLRREVDPLGIRRLEMAPARERGELLARCIAAEEDVAERAVRIGAAGASREAG